MSLGAILEFYNSATMNLTHNICKNKVYIDLSLLFLLHVKDEDCDGNVGITLTTLVRKSEVSTWSRTNSKYFLGFSDYRYMYLFLRFLLLFVRKVFPMVMYLSNND